MRRVVVRAALVLAGVVFALGLAELALRVAAPAATPTGRRGLHELRLDRPWLYGLRPGAKGTFAGETGSITYEINADGFRGRRYARPKPAGAFRIVVLGDSIAFGFGVEESQTLAQRLEERLSRTVGDRPVEVVNLGISGYNPYTEAALLRDVGLSYEPDLVLVQFCINDLNDPRLHFDAQTRIELGTIPDEAYPDPSAHESPSRGASSLLRACRKLRTCALLDDWRRDWFAVDAGDAEKRAALTPVDASDDRRWEWLERTYAAMARDAAQAGAKFAVLGVPYQGQLDGARPHPVQERLKRIAKRNGWVVVDPLPAFRRARASGGEPLFLDDWWHPSAAGDELLAEETLRELACGGLLPPGASGLCLRDSHATGGQ